MKRGSPAEYYAPYSVPEGGNLKKEINCEISGSHSGEYEEYEVVIGVLCHVIW
jgi:hypothetical protein